MLNSCEKNSWRQPCDIKIRFAFAGGMNRALEMKSVMSITMHLCSMHPGVSTVIIDYSKSNYYSKSKESTYYFPKLIQTLTNLVKIRMRDLRREAFQSRNHMVGMMRHSVWSKSYNQMRRVRKASALIRLDLFLLTSCLESDIGSLAKASKPTRKMLWVSGVSLSREIVNWCTLSLNALVSKMEV